MVQDGQPLLRGEKAEAEQKIFNYVSLRPQASWGRAPLHALKELEHQASRNICNLNFPAVFNQTISECNSIAESVKSTLKRAKHQIQNRADSERVIKNTYDKSGDYLDIWDRKIHIKQKALACQRKAMTHMLCQDLYVMVYSGLIRRDAEMINLNPDLKPEDKSNVTLLLSPLFHC